ncbi:MAG: SIMPL domain-containing protein [Candidatus Nealsonbacteria bacterium]
MENQNQNFHQCCKSKKKLISVFIIIISIFFVVLTVSTFFSIQKKIKETRYMSQNYIVVEGKGEISARSDLATINLSVITEKKTIGEATIENTKIMNNVIDFVKNQGVEEKDIKTIYFNIYPRYEYRQSSDLTEISFYPSGERTLVGYEITQQIEVKIRDLEKIGSIIEGATSAGANDVGNLYFTIDNEEELKKQARDQAIEKAKERAKELAVQLDFKLGKIIDFSENGYVPYDDYGYGKGGGVMIGEAEVLVAPEIETGENKIIVNVSLTFETR